MKLSIVTINTKKKDLTLACVDSLWDVYKTNFKNDEYELIIVDNKSEDSSIQEFKTFITKHECKNVHIIESTHTLGFGANNNLGVEKAKGDVILLLNNDTIVKDGITQMLSYMQQHSQVSILGGSLKNFDGTPQPCAGKFYTPFNALLLMTGMQRFGLLDKTPNRIEQVDWVKGALCMIRKEVFTSLGGFDEKIFMYTEDMELCYRAHLVGYKTYFFPTVTVFHKDQGSSNRTFAIVNIYKNLVYFYKKHRSASEYAFIKGLLILKGTVLIIFGKISHNTYLVETYEQALTTIR